MRHRICHSARFLPAACCRRHLRLSYGLRHFAYLFSLPLHRLPLSYVHMCYRGTKSGHAVAQGFRFSPFCHADGAVHIWVWTMVMHSTGRWMLKSGTVEWKTAEFHRESFLVERSGYVCRRQHFDFPWMVLEWDEAWSYRLRSYRLILHTSLMNLNH